MTPPTSSASSCEFQAVPPNELSFEGNMAENWNFFKQKFEIYLHASRLSDESEENKGYILLNRIGDKALKIYNNFQWSATERKNEYPHIKKKFEDYFIPTKNVTYERYLFFTRNKKETESYDTYVTNLRQLSSTCEFSTLVDSLIKDRLILGISDLSIKDRLLRESDLNLNKALEICRTAEVASERLKIIDGSMEADISMVKGNSSQRNTAGRRNYRMAQSVG